MENYTENLQPTAVLPVDEQINFFEQRQAEIQSERIDCRIINGPPYTHQADVEREQAELDAQITVFAHENYVGPYTVEDARMFLTRDPRDVKGYTEGMIFIHQRHLDKTQLKDWIARRDSELTSARQVLSNNRFFRQLCG